MTEYLTITEVIEMHRLLIDHYGGSHGLRDPGALEAALFRPQSGYYKNIIQEAAALWESLSQNHPFIDGNKRISFAATCTFLAINNCNITAKSTDIIDFIENLFKENKFEYKYLEEWLKNNTRQINS